MRVILVRHAYAGDPDPQRYPDDNERPLTDKGAKRFKKAAKGLANIAPQPSAVIAAPSTRTTQTADILEKHGGWPKAQYSKYLQDGADVEQVGKQIKKLHDAGHEIVGVVGHKPNLSELTHWLTAGAGSPLEKGGASIINWNSQPGTGEIQWMIPPNVLAALR